MISEVAQPLFHVDIKRTEIKIKQGGVWLPSTKDAGCEGPSPHVENDCILRRRLSGSLSGLLLPGVRSPPAV